jgi:hypothetical protein
VSEVGLDPLLLQCGYVFCPSFNHLRIFAIRLVMRPFYALSRVSPIGSQKPFLAVDLHTAGSLIRCRGVAASIVEDVSGLGAALDRLHTRNVRERNAFVPAVPLLAGPQSGQFFRVPRLLRKSKRRFPRHTLGLR